MASIEDVWINKEGMKQRLRIQEQLKKFQGNGQNTQRLILRLYFDETLISYRLHRTVKSLTLNFCDHMMSKYSPSGELDERRKVVTPRIRHFKEDICCWKSTINMWPTSTSQWYRGSRDAFWRGARTAHSESLP